MDDTESAPRTDGASQSAIPPIGATKTVTTPDGRSLSYIEVGDPHGPLVIHNHGGPSSRLEARLFAYSASKNRLRFICVDRPGMGQSSPQKARSYSGWAADLSTIADALRYDTFGVTGWSEGGPWALAAAAYIDPLRLRHVSSIAGGSYGTFGDNWAAQYLSKADAMGGQQERDDRLQLYAQAEQIALDQVGWLPLYNPELNVLVRPGVIGILFTPQGIIAPDWTQVRVSQ